MVLIKSDTTITKWKSAFLAHRTQIYIIVYSFVYKVREINMPLTTQLTILSLCCKNSTLLINTVS